MHGLVGPMVGTIALCALIGVGWGLLAAGPHGVIYVFFLSSSINGLCHVRRTLVQLGEVVRQRRDDELAAVPAEENLVNRQAGGLHLLVRCDHIGFEFEICGASRRDGDVTRTQGFDRLRPDRAIRSNRAFWSAAFVGCCFSLGRC
jgi:hypothetical protein